MTLSRLPAITNVPVQESGTCDCSDTDIGTLQMVLIAVLAVLLLVLLVGAVGVVSWCCVMRRNRGIRGMARKESVDGEKPHNCTVHTS